MERTGGLYDLLYHPAIYRFFQGAVAGDVLDRYIAEYVRPVRGDKVFDLGCGTGEILDHLPPVDYLGFDISESYIKAAQSRFGDRGRFVHGDVGLTTIDEEAGTFDVALATGVVHHLDDPTAIKLFELAAKALKPGGRLITFDGCFTPDQTRRARWVVSRDRGAHVRPADHYLKLANSSFSVVKQFIRHDLLRIPYTHLIMECKHEPKPT
jgi:SAM-dependent methyltransferase